MGGQLSSSVQDNYHVQKVKLGEGSFGVVWRGVNKKTGVTVAIKQLDKKKFALRNVSKADVEREIGILKVLNHENIIQLHENFEDSDFMYLTLDYCDGGDFGDKVLERGVDMTEPEVVYWSAQMLAAIDFMHGQRICHRDIKPDNFLVSGDRLKLADLGLATTCQPGAMLRDKCGTPAFMSPEQHMLPSGPGYSTPVDIWAAGLCVYMLTTGGHHPFLSSKNHLDNESLRQGKLDWKVGQSIFASLGLTGSRISDDLRALCHEMVCVDMRRRTTANQCLRRLGYPMQYAAAGSPGGPNGGYPNRSSMAGGQMATATAGIGKMIGGAASAARGAASAAGAALDKLPRPSFAKKRKQWVPQLGYIWMLQTPQGFVELPPQYHDVLEQQYRAYTSGQAPQVQLGINGSAYVVDFREMLCYTAGPSDSRTRVKAIQRVQRKG